jgi:Skp family chaperone for outer membrane proteins
VFQQKYQSGGFLTKESFEQEQNRLYKKDQELQSLAMRLEQEFANEQLKLSKQLMDTIDVFFLSYNKEHNFKLILNHADVLFADSTMNITEDVLEQLNERYAKKSDK